MSKGRKVVASTDEYTVYLRRDGRHSVEGADGKSINGDAKVAVLLKHDLVKAPPPKAPEPEPEAEAEAADGAEDSGSEDTAAEDAPADGAAEADKE